VVLLSASIAFPGESRVKKLTLFLRLIGRENRRGGKVGVSIRPKGGRVDTRVGGVSDSVPKGEVEYLAPPDRAPTPYHCACWGARI